MKPESFDLEILTPCFCGGAEPRLGDAELRPPSIRGQLRWWHRAAGSSVPESEVWGSAAGDRGQASAVLVRIAPFDAESERWRLLPHADPDSRNYDERNKAKAQRSALHKVDVGEVKQNIVFAVQLWRTARCTDRAWNEVKRVMGCWSWLGGLGARQNRAAGSIWPVGNPPSKEHFETLVLKLALPTNIYVRVLGATEAEDAEPLRIIASDTVQGLDADQIPGNPLGYVDRDLGRKASPLKLKVGRFADGYRLIAAWDNRDGRGGELHTAIQEMCAAGKTLGFLLRDVGFEQVSIDAAAEHFP